MKFTVITNAEHIILDCELWSYGAYVREMNIWFRHLDEVLIVAPVVSKKITAIELPYQHSVFKIKEVPTVSLTTVQEICKAIFLFPFIFRTIFLAMHKVDHIHLRCPGNIGLLGCIVQVFFPKKPKTVKYAGNWDPIATQPWSYRFQKWLLNNAFLTRNVKVLVYGKWPGQSKNIVPFFTASFSKAEKSVVEKKFNPVFKFLFVGSLVEGKNPLLAIELIEKLITRALPVKLEIYGDGPMRKKLENLVKIKSLDPFVTFFGNQNLEIVKNAYKNAHFLVLFSKSEGWPKAVAEAMFFGCIPIATAVSCVPWMLNYGSRGILIPGIGERGKRRVESWDGGKIVERGKRTVDSWDGKKIVDRGQSTVESRTGLMELESERGLESTVDKIIELINHPTEIRRMSLEAQEWSQQYTLEKFEEAIEHILASNKDINKKSSSPLGRGGGVG